MTESGPGRTEVYVHAGSAGNRLPINNNRLRPRHLVRERVSASLAELLIIALPYLIGDMNEVPNALQKPVFYHLFFLFIMPTHTHTLLGPFPCCNATYGRQGSLKCSEDHFHYFSLALHWGSLIPAQLAAGQTVAR